MYDYLLAAVIPELSCFRAAGFTLFHVVELAGLWFAHQDQEIQVSQAAGGENPCLLYGRI